jgi:hypothetical protein
MDTTAIPLASAVISVELDMSKFKAQMASISQTIQQSGSKISSSMTNALTAQTKATGASIKEAITVIDRRMQQVIKPILTAAVGMAFGGIYKFLSTTDQGAYKLQRSVNSLHYAWNQLLARIGRVVAEHFNLSTNIGKIVNYINSLDDKKLGKLLDKALWAAVAGSVMLMARGFVSIAADWKTMMNLKWLEAAVNFAKVRAGLLVPTISDDKWMKYSMGTKGGMQIWMETSKKYAPKGVAGSAIGAGEGAMGIGMFAQGAAAASGMLTKIWQGILAFLPKIVEGFKFLGGVLSKLWKPITALLSVFAILGDEGTVLERSMQGLGKIWKWFTTELNYVWKVVSLLLDAFDALVVGLLFLTDVAKSFVHSLKYWITGDYKAMGKKLWADIKKDFSVMMDTLKSIWINIKDTVFFLTAGAFGEKKKNADPMTFAAKSIQTVGFTELGRAQQQLAIQTQMVKKEEEIADNTKKTAEFLKEIVEKVKRSGTFSKLPLSPVFSTGSGGAGSSGSGGGGGGGGGW